jgi:hypothetical protein
MPVLRRVGSLYGIDIETDFTLRRDLSLRPPVHGRGLELVAGPVSETGTELWRSTAAPEVVCTKTESGAVLRWPDAAFLVTSEAVIVDAVDPAWAFERYFNPVMSLAIAARGGATLHAFVVRIPQGTVAIMGRSGYGKSSLGIELLERGGLLVSDDVLALDGSGALQPGPSFVRYVCADVDLHDPGGKARRIVPSVDGPVTPDLVVVITREVSGFDRVTRQMDAVDLLLGQMYSPIAAEPDVRKVNLRHAVRLASTVPVYECGRHHRPVGELADRTISILRRS